MKLAQFVVLCLAAQLAGTVAGGRGASASPALQAPQGQPNVPLECPLPPGWDTVAARNPKFVVFGEVHGTQQSPAFVGDLACGLAVKGERILVAVEHPAAGNAAFQTAWRHKGPQFMLELGQAGWAQRNDGIGSEAMLALLERLHQLAQRGLSVDVVAFNGMKDEAQQRRFAGVPGQGAHEAAQAENIRSAAGARPYDYVLVLVGNVHARKRPVEHLGGAFEPMAMQLGPPETIVSLNMETAGGTAWNCELKPGFKPQPNAPITSDAITCGSKPLSGRVDRQQPPFMALTPLPGESRYPDYDGVFWLGRVSASPQAVIPR